VHLRRALLLFALVLGLAALVASLSQPPRESRQQPPRQARGAPTATPLAPGPTPAAVEFALSERPRTRRLGVGRPAVVTVEVPKAGQVEILGLGLSATAEPLTPARFDVLSSRPGRYEVRFTPAGSLESRKLGTLLIDPSAR
jgi:hypothetical protein